MRMDEEEQTNETLPPPQPQPQITTTTTRTSEEIVKSMDSLNISKKESYILRNNAFLLKFENEAIEFVEQYSNFRPTDGKVNGWKFAYDILCHLSERKSLIKDLPYLVYWMWSNFEGNDQLEILGKDIFISNQNQLTIKYEAYEKEEELKEVVTWFIQFLMSPKLTGISVKKSWYILLFEIFQFDHIHIRQMVLEHFQSVIHKMNKWNPKRIKLVIFFLNNTKLFGEYVKYINEENWYQLFLQFPQELTNHLNMDQFSKYDEVFLTKFLISMNRLIGDCMLNDYKLYGKRFAQDDIGKIRKVCNRLMNRAGIKEELYRNFYRSSALSYFSFLLSKFRRSLKRGVFDISISTFIQYCLFAAKNDAFFRKIIFRTLYNFKQYDIYNALMKLFPDDTQLREAIINKGILSSFVRYNFSSDLFMILNLSNPFTIPNIFTNDLILYLWQRDWMFQYGKLLSSLIPNKNFRRMIINPSIEKYEKSIKIDRKIFLTELDNDNLSKQYYQLPLLDGKYTVHWVDDIDEILRLISTKLINEKVLSLDCEWVANNMEGTSSSTHITAPISLLQIGLLDKSTYLIDMDKLYNFNRKDEMKIKKFKEFFQNFSILMMKKEILKLGFGFSSDMAMFHKYFEENLNHDNFYDLTYVKSNINTSIHTFLKSSNDNKNRESMIQGGGLSNLTDFLLSHPLDKQEQMSVWCMRPLRLQQIIYAMTDVQVLLEIAQFIEEKIRNYLLVKEEMNEEEPFKYLLEKFPIQQLKYMEKKTKETSDEDEEMTTTMRDSGNRKEKRERRKEKRNLAIARPVLKLKLHDTTYQLNATDSELVKQNETLIQRFINNTSTVGQFHFLVAAQLESLKRELRRHGCLTSLLDGDNVHLVENCVKFIQEPSKEYRCILICDSMYQRISSFIPEDRRLYIPNRPWLLLPDETEEDTTPKLPQNVTKLYRVQAKYVFKVFSLKFMVQDIFSRCAHCNCKEYDIMDLYEFLRHWLFAKFMKEGHVMLLHKIFLELIISSVNYEGYGRKKNNNELVDDLVDDELERKTNEEEGEEEDLKKNDEEMTELDIEIKRFLRLAYHIEEEWSNNLLLIKRIKLEKLNNYIKSFIYSLNNSSSSDNNETSKIEKRRFYNVKKWRIIIKDNLVIDDKLFNQFVIRDFDNGQLTFMKSNTTTIGRRKRSHSLSANNGGKIQLKKNTTLFLVASYIIRKWQRMMIDGNIPVTSKINQFVVNQIRTDLEIMAIRLIHCLWKLERKLSSNKLSAVDFGAFVKYMEVPFKIQSSPSNENVSYVYVRTKIVENQSSKQHRRLEEGNDKLMEFFICKSCAKIYWIGSHWNNINERFNHVLQCI
ncbi:hypothetical protein SNEBB_007863 [Seison nebaliae]|nr:hypothetical protein SNEBB_007863 [Seison nebaliae]